MSEKQTFTDLRKHRHYPGIAAWFSSPERQQFEQRFGHILSTPLDLPPLVLHDKQKFRDWFFNESKSIVKIRPDVASATHAGPTFQSISSPNHIDPIWTTNNREDIEQLFPEIGQAVARLPLLGEPSYSLWSSMATVHPHRDQGPWTDGPCAIRIKVYDENPRETLYVEEMLPDHVRPIGSPRLVPTNVGTSTFAWNNLRTKHGSFFNPKHRKVLLIISKHTFDIPRYSELLERSISKFGRSVYTSKRSITDFVEQVDWVGSNPQG